MKPEGRRATLMPQFALKRHTQNLGHWQLRLYLPDHLGQLRVRLLNWGLNSGW